MSAKKKVAVIGCGPSGISLLSAFQQAKLLYGEEIPEIKCFEKQSTVGGMWNYQWQTAFDSYGEPSHSAMYDNLWTNNAKEYFEFFDYTFDEHFKKPTPSYINREAMLDYIKGRSEKFGIAQYVLFNTVVRNVMQVNHQFLIMYENIADQKSYSETFDYVIVATSHFAVPYFPSFQGIEQFKGRILHSLQFRYASEFKDKKVLIIGAALSAEDVGMQCYKYGAREIVTSYHTFPQFFPLPPGVKEFPEIREFNGNVCHFINGEKFEPEIIFFCTGFQHHYPFMSDNLRLRTKNSYYPENLYKGVLLCNNMNVAYIGAQNQSHTLPYINVQAYFIRDYIMGRLKYEIQNESDREKDIILWINRMKCIKSVEDTSTYQIDYMKDLIEYCRYPAAESLPMLDKMIRKTMTDKRNDMLTYRDQTFISWLTGKESIAPKVSWLHQFDDTFATFKKDYSL